MADAKQALLIANQNKPQTSITAAYPDARPIDPNGSTPPEILVARQAWQDQDKASLDQFAAELSAAGQHKSAENIAFLSSLYFEEGEALIRAAEDFRFKRQHGFSFTESNAFDTTLEIWKER